MMKIPRNCKLPDWFTIPPLEDGSYVALDDPMVREMFVKFSERLPSYNQKYLHEYNQREGQTLIHGDFHGANNMFGENENEREVITFDFQGIQHGLVTTDLIYMMTVTNLDIVNYNDVEDIIKGKECFFE